MGNNVMFEELQKLSKHFLEINNRPYKRYFIQSTVLKHRCAILLGQRGIGKTTILVQYLLQKSHGDPQDPKIMYVPTDHILMANTSLYEIADKFQALGGQYIVFDEIHKYSTWSREIKSIYDTFPKLSILGSGSSALEIQKGSHDLSRRAIEYHMHGLSFREFIELKCDIEFQYVDLTELINNHDTIARDIMKKLDEKNKKVLPLFKDYLNHGFYPYFLEVDDEETYWITLEQNARATIESDLSAIYPQLTGNSVKKLKQLLLFIASAVPFTPTWSKIKRIIDVTDDRTVKNYFKYLEDASLIRIVQSYSKNMRKLESPEKIYLNNPNQIQAFSTGKGNRGNIRETFFLNMLVPNHKVSLPAYGDFIVDETYTFEIGGRKKNFNQIKNIDNALLACDNTEIGINQRIPLWLLGFLY